MLLNLGLWFLYFFQDLFWNFKKSIFFMRCCLKVFFFLLPHSYKFLSNMKAEKLTSEEWESCDPERKGEGDDFDKKYLHLFWDPPHMVLCSLSCSIESFCLPWILKIDYFRQRGLLRFSQSWSWINWSYPPNSISKSVLE